MTFGPPLPRQSLAPLAAFVLVLQTACASDPTETFSVELKPQKHRLYRDPYNGSEIFLGGFSGLYPVPGRPDRLYAITDRGPAPDYMDATGRAYKTWAVPGFGPHIVTLDLQPHGQAKVRELRPLIRPQGTPITGLPTTVPFTDSPYNFFLQPLPFDEDSLDAEGITLDAAGNFWVCEEYKPSIAQIAPDGRVLLRLVPHGTRTGAENVPTFDVLPKVLAKRRNNRGFEGIAVSADGWVYAIMQRPLNNPNRAAADANGNIRIVAIDPNALSLGTGGIRQYIYPAPPGNASVTVSDLFWVGPNRLLVPERGTDKLFEVHLGEATDITSMEDADGRLIGQPSKTIEQLDAAGLVAARIQPVTKTIVLDSMMQIDPLLEKVEGVCLIGDFIALTYDNDFNVAEAASTPSQPLPEGPVVQLELLGENLPKVFVVPRP